MDQRKKTNKKTTKTTTAMRRHLPLKEIIECIA
jgi:hypothetical protein